VVFLCDGYFDLVQQENKEGADHDIAYQTTTRFFKFTKRLPMELQMVLCNRVFGLSRDVISLADTEEGLKALVVNLHYHK